MECVAGLLTIKKPGDRSPDSISVFFVARLL